MPEQLFAVASSAALCGWVGLAVAAGLPRGAAQSRTLWLAGRLLPLALCAIYGVVLVRYWGTTPQGGFSSLGAVQALFASPGKMLGAWLHFLAFDLLVARWIVDDVLARQGPRLSLLLALPATLMYGPLGVLIYLGLRQVRRRPARAG